MGKIEVAIREFVQVLEREANAHGTITIALPVPIYLGLCQEVLARTVAPDAMQFRNRIRLAVSLGTPVVVMPDLAQE